MRRPHLSGCFPCPPQDPAAPVRQSDLQQQASLHGLLAGDEVRLHEQDVLAQLLWGEGQWLPGQAAPALPGGHGSGPGLALSEGSGLTLRVNTFTPPGWAQS